MTALTESKRNLLMRLAAEGKASQLALGEIECAKSLVCDGLIFMVGGTAAIITPKGRHLLVGEQVAKKPDKKPPFGFLE
jgi:hypothetical protein